MTAEPSVDVLQREIARPTLPINVRQVMADGIIAVAAKAQDWPMMHQAIDLKIADQREVVAWWDRTISPRERVGRKLDPAHDLRQGLSTQQVSRWRKSLADEGKYHTVIFLKACKAAHIVPDDNHRANGTGDNEWFTPPEYVAAARDVLGGIDLDPASHEIPQRWIKATQYYTAADDALARPWHGRVWLNPPYSRELIPRFAQKMVDEIAARHVSAAVMLTHAYTDTQWFHTLASVANALCLMRGRIGFLDANDMPCNPTQGQVFFYFGSEGREKFHTYFGQFGCVVHP